MRNFLLKLFSYVIFLAAYSVAVFLLIDGWDDAFWTSYIFAVLPVIFAAVYTLLLDRKIAAKFLSYQLLYVLFSYVGIAVIMNTLFAAFHAEYSYVVPLVVNVVLLAVYAIYFILHLRAVNAISENVKQDKFRMQFVRIASQKLELIMNSVTNLNEQKKIEKVYDAVRNAQALSNEYSDAIEQEIMTDIYQLGTLVDSDNFEAAGKLSASIISKINQRDLILKSAQVV